MSDDRTSDIVEGAGRHAAWIFAKASTALLAEATKEWMKPENLQEATRLATSHLNNLPPHKAGHAFEFIETLRFNNNAALAGETVRAVTTASQGAGTAAMDIRIMSADQVVLRDVQAKVYEKGTEALVALSREDYEDMQRLVPADKEAGVRQALAKALDRSPEEINTSRFLDVQENLTGELRYGDITSGGTKFDEAYTIAEDPVGWLKDQAHDAVVNETLGAAVAGAAAGAVFGAASHSLRLALRARHEDLGVSESIIEVAKVAAMAGVRSGVSSGLAKVVEIGARNSDVFFPLAETTAPIAIASAVLDIGEAAYQYATGGIDRRQLIDRCGGVAIRNSSAWAYGVVGQTLVPIPVVGAMVGCTAGYVTSALVLEGFKMARVAAAAAAAAAEERLAELETQVLAAVMTMEECRLDLERLIDQEAQDYRETLVPLMDGLEQSLTAGHDTEAMDCLVTLNLQLGAKLDWSTLPEFDEFMADPDRSLQL